MYRIEWERAILEAGNAFRECDNDSGKKLLNLNQGNVLIKRNIWSWESFKRTKCIGCFK